MFDEITISTIKRPEGRFQTFHEISLSEEQNVFCLVQYIYCIVLHIGIYLCWRNSKKRHGFVYNMQNTTKHSTLSCTLHSQTTVHRTFV